MDDLLASVAQAFDTTVQYERPGDLAKALMPDTVQTPALDLIDEALVDVAEGRCRRLMIFMPPQEGKSERTSHVFPLWMLMRNPNLRVAICSYDLATARRWGLSIRADIMSNRGQDGMLDLGLSLRRGSASAQEWKLAAHRGGMFCCGIEGGITGRPVDLLVIDDPVANRQDADSKRIREICWDFWTSAARTRLAPGAPVVLIMTRWHEDDLAGHLLEQAKNDPSLTQWRVISLPAQAEANDQLGRAEGEYLISARKGRNDGDNAEWKETEKALGPRDWAALYQQRPAPQTGNVLKRHWWKRYQVPRAFQQPDGTWRAPGPGMVMQSWDMSFKDTDGTDYVVGQVWQRNGAEITLLDQVRARMDFTAARDAVERLSAKWPQARLKLIEDKANGPAVISSLRKKVPGLVPYSPKDSKLARANAVAPFVEAGNVWIPDKWIAPWVDGFVEECAAFPNATHDDQVDAFTQAATRLLLEGGPAFSFMESLLRERGVTILNRQPAAN